MEYPSMQRELRCIHVLIRIDYCPVCMSDKPVPVSTVCPDKLMPSSTSAQRQVEGEALLTMGEASTHPGGKKLRVISCAENEMEYGSSGKMEDTSLWDDVRSMVAVPR